MAPLPVPARPGARRRRTGGTVLPSKPSADDGGLRCVWRWLLHNAVPGANAIFSILVQPHNHMT